MVMSCIKLSENSFSLAKCLSENKEMTAKIVHSFFMNEKKIFFINNDVFVGDLSFFTSYFVRVKKGK
jgi:hypothetical protein